MAGQAEKHSVSCTPGHRWPFHVSIAGNLLADHGINTFPALFVPGMEHSHFQSFQLLGVYSLTSHFVQKNKAGSSQKLRPIRPRKAVFNCQWRVQAHTVYAFRKKVGKFRGCPNVNWDTLSGLEIPGFLGTVGFLTCSSGGD